MIIVGRVLIKFDNENDVDADDADDVDDGDDGDVGEVDDGEGDVDDNGVGVGDGDVDGDGVDPLALLPGVLPVIDVSRGFGI